MSKKRVGLGQNNWKSKLFYALLLIIPVTQFLIFYVVVNINSFSLAFKKFGDSGKLSDYTFCGFDNFKQWFSKGTEYNLYLKKGLLVSLKAYAINLVVGIPLGLFFSYYMFKKMPGSKAFRVLLFMPSILSAAVLGVLYQNGLDQMLNEVLREVFHCKRINFWDKDHGFGSMMIFSVLISFGGSVLMYTNKMNSISPEVIESAHLDGANGLKEFWYIVLPNVYSVFTVFFISSLTVCFSNQYNGLMFQSFARRPWMSSLGYYLWAGVNQAANNESMRGGLAIYASLGVMMTLVIVPITFFVRYLLNHYGWSEE